MICESAKLTLNGSLFLCPAPAAHGSPMEGTMVMSSLEWTPENIKKAERACRESQQIVVIKTIDVSVPGDATL